jgi:DNA polymerase III subunit alpha
LLGLPKNKIKKGNKMSFVSLHNHSYYSILDALPSPKDLILRAKELNQPAIALTDHGTFAGTWDAYKASKEIGVKLIVGAEFYFLSDVSKKDEKLRHVILLAQNATGYRNLLSLNRKGFDNALVTGRKVLPLIDWSSMAQHSEGVICLTACGNGIVGQHINSKNFEAAETDTKRLLDIFGRDNLGLEVQPHALNRTATPYHSSVNQVFTNYHIIKLAEKFDIRVVPTTNTHYLKKEHASMHDVLLAIGAMQPTYSNARLKYNVPELYLKSHDEVKSFFARNFGEKFAEEICNNTMYFADKCEVPDWIDPKFSNPDGKELPSFAVSEVSDYSNFQDWLGSQSDEIKKLAEDSAYLRYRCYQVFEHRLRNKVSTLKEKEYIDRIEEELSVLDFQGFSSYMLIVADYIDWARKNNIGIGPGRGSVGGSLIAYLLDIHKADPIRYGLIFARFQNRERSSPPDIDQDIATSGREAVINYIQTKYGNDKVAFISNFSRITPKVYTRDIARSLEFGGSRKDAVRIGNLIADSISKESKNSIEFNELKSSPLFMEYVKRYPQLSQNANILGKVRNFSTHAAALVISRRPLAGLVPVRKDKDNNQALEYEKYNTEENGLLKIDVLGLSTLDLIQSTINLINKTRESKIKLEDIDFEDYDKKTYDLISRGDTFGVFQLGTSAGTIELCKKIKPKNIEDLAIITTLARPAAKNIIDDFIKTREGKREFKLLHPSLRNAFEKTYGFGLFDESILQLGKDVAGWSLNESDRIRKLIKEKGKNPEKIKKLREEFIEGAAKNGIGQTMGSRIWDEEISKFQGYTFNKSHAVMYSFISYITAWLKANYPIEFLLANLMADIRSNAPDTEANIARAKMELRQYKVKILPPNINRSQMDYELLDRNTLLTGLDALKFVGDDAIQDILEKRPFTSFDDFMLRTDSRKVRSSTIQALAASGCLDEFGISRKLMYLYCSDYRKKLQVWLKRHDPKVEQFSFPWSKEEEWFKPELFALEKHYLGESFVCTKKDAFGKFFKDNTHANVSTIKLSKNKTSLHSIKVEIKTVFELKVKKENSRFLGQEMAKVSIEDEYGVQCNLTIFPEKWNEIKQKIKESRGRLVFEPGYAIHFGGTCNLYENEMGVILEHIYEIVPPPALPKDLKAKKMAIKNTDASVMPETSDLIQELEDQLFTEGLVDLDEDPFSLDI